MDSAVNERFVFDLRHSTWIWTTDVVLEAKPWPRGATRPIFLWPWELHWHFLASLSNSVCDNYKVIAQKQSNFMYAVRLSDVLCILIFVLPLNYDRSEWRVSGQNVPSTVIFLFNFSLSLLCAVLPKGLGIAGPVALGIGFRPLLYHWCERIL